MLENKVILLLIDHYQSLGLVRSIGEAGISPIIFLIGKGPLIPNCKYAKNITYVRDNKEGLDLIIEKYGNERLKPFLIASSDKDVIFLDQNYERLKDHFYFSNCGEAGMFTKYMNKEENAAVAKRNGLLGPREEHVKTGELPKNLNYPVITKALVTTVGAWKGDVFICNNETELVEAYKKIKSPELIIQEFIVKKNELSVHGMSIGGGKCIMPFKIDYIRLYKEAYGHYMTFHLFNEYEELYKKIQATIKEMNYSGLFEAEFIQDKNGELYFLEINMRHATWGNGVTHAGVNLPYLWIISTLNGDIDKSCLNNRIDGFRPMVGPIDYLLNVKRGSYSRIKWWRDRLLRTDFDYYLGKNDCKPLFTWMLKNWKQFVWRNYTKY